MNPNPAIDAGPDTATAQRVRHRASAPADAVAAVAGSTPAAAAGASQAAGPVPPDAAATAARTAACACGELRLTAYGEPLGVYACACLECQRATGSAFSYRARYATDRIAVDGEPRRWRRGSDAGRWVEHCFCARCGSLLYMAAEALPDAVVISVGAFADPGFAAPDALYRSARRHPWYDPGCRLL